MKKEYVVILILMFATAGYLSIRNFIESKKQQKEIEQKQEIILSEKEEDLILVDSYETKIENREDVYMKFEVKYPYFKKAGEDFNKSIENLLKEQIENDSVVGRENWEARIKTEEGLKIAPSTWEKFYFSSDFEIIQSNSLYISFILKYGGYIGGAHGYQEVASFNYDIKNQKILSLNDIFKDNPDFLNYLSKESRDILSSKFALINEDEIGDSSKEAIEEYIKNINSGIEEGTKPIIENFSIFTFYQNKIKIYFKQYQVVPYAMGMPEIEIDIK